MVARKSKLGKISPIVVLMMLLALTGMTGTASAAHLNCGDIVTTNTTLTHDITGCTEGGLIIGADNITLNLGGYTIEGIPGEGFTGDGVGIYTNGHSGVQILGGTRLVDGVVVKGSVKYFDAGVVIDGLGFEGEVPEVAGGNNTVSGVVLDSNQGNPQTDFGDGLLIVGSSNNKVENNTVTNNGPYDGIGIIGLNDAGPLPSDSNKIEGNYIADNKIGFVHHGAPSVDDGIRVEPLVTNTVVKENTVVRSGLDNIAVFNTAQNTLVKENYVDGALARNGIHVFNPSTVTVSENTVCGSKQNGIMLGLGQPVGGPSLVLNNNVGAGTAGCAPNGDGTTSFDLHDSQMNRPSAAGGGPLPATPPGVPCGAHVWRGNFTAGDTYNHNCTTNP